MPKARKPSEWWKGGSLHHKASYKKAVSKICGYVARESRELEKACKRSTKRGVNRARCLDSAANARSEAMMCVAAIKKSMSGAAVSAMSRAIRDHEQARAAHLKINPDPRSRRG